uniref:Uncharacterized protein n=1 Tax=Anguilla anguilla TaxID=7936 RepID=A0A0E9SN03_ANGAN
MYKRKIQISISIFKNLYSLSECFDLNLFIA